MMKISLAVSAQLLVATHILAATFVFNNGTDAYDGQVTDTLTASGIVMTVSAALESGSSNRNALLAANNSGVYIGIQSENDPAPGNSARPRISNTRDELLLISFDHEVEITEIKLRSFNANNGSEDFRMRFESGTDPFTGLNGYEGDYSILTSPTPRLKYNSSSGVNGANTVPIGVEGQDPLILQAGTVVSLSTTASKTTDGGLLIESISVREPGNRGSIVITNIPAFTGQAIVSNPPMTSDNATLVGSGNMKGQTLRLFSSGTVDGLILQLDDQDAPADIDGSLRVAMYALNGDYPSGSPLFSGEGILPSGLSTGDFIRIDFSPPVQLSSGKYAFTLSSSDASLSFNLTTGNRFAEGELIRNNSTTGNEWASASSSGIDLIFALLGTGGERPAPAMGPNIIMVLADDLGWTDISAGGPNRGNQSGFYETPNLERLAREGLSFTSCYVQPNCAPTRAALLSGQYPPRTGNGVYVVNNLNRGDGTPLLKGPSQNEDVPSAAITLAESMQATGYVTAHFGKYHVGGHEGGTATLPLHQGFDYNYGGGSAGNPGNYRPDDSSGTWKYGGKVGPELDAYADPYTQQYIDEILTPYDHGSNVDTVLGEEKFLTDAMGDAIVEFMDTHRGGSMSNYPFYVQFHTYAVHTPIQSRSDLKTYYEGKSISGGHDNATYAGLIEGMDQAVGRIMDYLADPDGDGSNTDSIATNTLLLFCSDNGGFIGPTDNAPLRGRKGMFYEGGIRVPLICRWSGTVPTNAVSDTLIHAVDFYPTFLELAGGEQPNPTNHPLDGVSFAPHLSNPVTARNREPIVYHFPGYLDDRARPCSMAIGDVGGKRYKLIYTYDTEYTIRDNNGSAITTDDPWELYCLSDDIGETSDILDGDYWKWITHEAVAGSLATDINAWHTQDDPTWTPTYPEVRATGEVLTEPPAAVDPVVVPEGEQFRIQSFVHDEESGALSMSWGSAPGYSFGIETSSNMLTWTSLTNGIPSQGSQTSHAFTDPGTTTNPVRFYRTFIE